MNIKLNFKNHFYNNINQNKYYLKDLQLFPLENSLQKI